MSPSPRSEQMKPFRREDYLDGVVSLGWRVQAPLWKGSGQTAVRTSSVASGGRNFSELRDQWMSTYCLSRTDAS